MKYLIIVAFSIGILASSALASDVRVIDGDTLVIGEKHFRLHGIDAPEAGQKCTSKSGKTWRCGHEATTHLSALTEGRNVECDNRGQDDFDRTIGVCRVDGIDLNSAMIEHGYAWAFRKYSLDYVDVESSARKSGKGIWQSDTETPWDFRARRWEVASQVAPKGCPIKGNISNNGRIYHAPWSPWYSRTKVSLQKGERWFCSEREALDAGWRAPFWGN